MGTVMLSKGHVERTNILAFAGQKVQLGLWGSWHALNKAYIHCKELHAPRSQSDSSHPVVFRDGNQLHWQSRDEPAIFDVRLELSGHHSAIP